MHAYMYLNCVPVFLCHVARLMYKYCVSLLFTCSMQLNIDTVLTEKSLCEVLVRVRV